MMTNVPTVDTKNKQVNDMFSFWWNSSGVSNTSGKAVGRTIEICCEALSNYYPHDLNEQELVKEMQVLNRLQKIDILGEKLLSIVLLNKIYEKDLQTILPQVCVALRLFVSILESAFADCIDISHISNAKTLFLDSSLLDSEGVCYIVSNNYCYILLHNYCQL